MRNGVPVVLIALGYLISVVVYNGLPAEVPIHWDLSGEPDRWVAKFWGAVALPTIMLVNWLIFLIMARMDPRQANLSKFEKTYDRIVNAGTGLLLLVHVLALGTALGWTISLPGLLTVGIGVLLVVLGNVLPRARQNWSFGIRTPWTLENRRAWDRTQRVGGVLLVLTGMLTIGAGILRPSIAMSMMLAALLGASAVAVIFSYVAWRREVRR